MIIAIKHRQVAAAMGSEVCVNSKGARLCALEQMSEVLECECLYLIAT